jgi:hypothetical protein
MVAGAPTSRRHTCAAVAEAAGRERLFEPLASASIFGALIAAPLRGLLALIAAKHSISACGNCVTSHGWQE